MSYFNLNSRLLQFLHDAQRCFKIQPDRQYFIQKQNDHENIEWLLIVDDPCQTMARPNGRRTCVLYDGSILAGYIDYEVLLSHQWRGVADGKEKD